MAPTLVALMAAGVEATGLCLLIPLARRIASGGSMLTKSSWLIERANSYLPASFDVKDASNRKLFFFSSYCLLPSCCSAVSSIIWSC